MESTYNAPILVKDNAPLALSPSFPQKYRSTNTFYPGGTPMVRLRMRSFVKSVSFLAAFSLLLNFTAVPKVAGKKQDENHGNQLNTDFQNAATEFGVPRELLVAIAYAETRLVDHKEEPSSSG